MMLFSRRMAIIELKGLNNTPDTHIALSMGYEISKQEQDRESKDWNCDCGNDTIVKTKVGYYCSKCYEPKKEFSNILRGRDKA